MPKQQDQQIQEKMKCLEVWMRLSKFLYRILILLGLALLILVIILLALTAQFSPWILLVPGFLIGLGIFLAWVEYTLHNRRLRLVGPQSDHEDEAVQT